ncbi:MAG: hypothetical protein GEU90_20955 [Gemmatimonas sp.]|nr:hypothetical protein [Gemmatimonas sp.]
MHRLPYGRTSKAGEHSLVLIEGRGTCSSKHALLAALARNHGAPVYLLLGLYEMNEQSTPGVAAVLESYGLETVPEAHCVISCEGVRIDVTHPDSSGACEIGFLMEKEIMPEEVGDAKQIWHRRQIEIWCSERSLDPATVWEARETCIAVLSGSPSANIAVNEGGSAAVRET